MHLLFHLATVAQALDNFYNQHLKTWAVPIGAIGIVASALLWMIGTAGGNDRAGAIGIKGAIICIVAVALVYGAADLANMGKSFAP